MIEKDKLQVKEVLSQLKKVLGVRTDAELASLFKVRPNTLSSWKKRNSMDYESLIILCIRHNIALEDLLRQPLDEEGTSLRWRYNSTG